MGIKHPYLVLSVDITVATPLRNLISSCTYSKVRRIGALSRASCVCLSVAVHGVTVAVLHLSSNLDGLTTCRCKYAFVGHTERPPHNRFCTLTASLWPSHGSYFASNHILSEAAPATGMLPDHWCLRYQPSACGQFVGSLGAPGVARPCC